MGPLHVAYAVLVALLWGGNFVAAKVALGHFEPFFLTLLRFVFVAALLLPFVPRPTRAQLKSIGIIAILSTLHFSLPYVGLAMGLNIASTAITTQLGVPFSCMLGALMLQDKLGIWRLSGMVIAFIGMTVVFGTPNILDHKLAFIITVTGAFFWGMANVLLKKSGSIPPFEMLAWMALFIVPQQAVLTLLLEPGAHLAITTAPMSAILALIYTVLASTLVAHGLWYHLLRTHPVTQVAPYSLITPVAGALFGQIFFDEIITWHIIVGGAVTIAGVAIIVMRRPKIMAQGKVV